MVEFVTAKIEISDSKYFVGDDGNPQVLLPKLNNLAQVSLGSNEKDWIKNMDDMLKKEDEFYLPSLIEKKFNPNSPNYYYKVTKDKKILYKREENEDWSSYNILHE